MVKRRRRCDIAIDECAQSPSFNQLQVRVHALILQGDGGDDAPSSGRVMGEQSDLLWRGPASRSDGPDPYSVP